MATNKNIHIVIQGSFRCIFANIKGVKDFSKSEKFVTWKQQIIEKEEIAKNPLRLLFTLEDKGRIHNLSKDTMITYTFKKSEVGKYIKFYAYVENFETIQQSTIFYVEDKCNTNIRIRGVGRIDSDSSEVAVGQKIKLKVNEYNVSENKVSDSVKKNIKWMIKVGNEADERLFIDGLVVTGDEIEFSVPEEWAEREVILMPYLNIHTPKISCKFMCDEMYIPSCGGTWVKPIGDEKYEVLDVFLGRDKSNRIFYLDGMGNPIVIGYSATPYSFYNDDEGAKQAVKGAIIDNNDNSGRKFLNEDIIGLANDKRFGEKGNVRPMSLWYYILNAKGGERYDFKVTNGTDNKIYEDDDIEGKYRGMPINVFPLLDKPVYCSARDIGNIAAGLIAGMHGLSWLEGRVGFDGLESWQKEKLAFEAKGTQYAQKFGHNFGYNVIWKKIQAKELSRLPSYGELKPENIKEDQKILREGDLYIIGW